MKAYLCVYRYIIPTRKAWEETKGRAESEPMLAKFLNRYGQPDSFYDWGDDPSFFSASEILGSVDRATWGVCCRDVRDAMSPEDFVVFFCGKERAKGLWDYFYVGLGTIDQLLDRNLIWSEDSYGPYRRFFNVLARPVNGELRQYESIHPYHPDWERRASAPYLVFNPAASRFNLRNPHLVASYDRHRSSIEQWQDDPVARQLAALVLPDAPSRRGLRSVNIQRSHPKMNLETQALRSGGYDALKTNTSNLSSNDPDSGLDR